MSERPALDFLTAFRRALRHVRLYPPEHPLTTETIAAVTRAVDGLMPEDRGEVVLTLLDDSFYQDRTLLGHASLEFNGLLRELQERGVDSLTFTRPVRQEELAALVDFLAEVVDEAPAGTTVRVNERPLTYHDLQEERLSELRTAYATSLDVLRSFGLAIRAQDDFGLSGVAIAVENLLEKSMSHPGATLLLASVKSHDEYTFFHSVNTCILSLAVGRLVGLNEEQLRLLGMGAVLHDIGKVGVAPTILRKPGRLAHDDWEQIKLHPQEGAQSILAAAGQGQELAAVIALEHHARFDGSGYPKLGHGDGHGHDPHGTAQLHLYSRLVSVVDTYDAITTRRSYRRAETPTRALNVLLNGAGTSYDPDLVRAFIHLMGAYPPGSLLRLHGGEVVMVVEQSVSDPDRPHAVMVRDGRGTLLETPEPYRFTLDDVVDQLLPGRAGVDPASLLEAVAGSVGTLY